jgi:protein involved in polysaccharide export with SLBB domain
MNSCCTHASASWAKAPLLSVVLVGLFAAGAGAQQSQQPRTKPVDNSDLTSATQDSALARENNSRVAASAAQLKSILSTDPGMMVELKRWIATDATNNGQVVLEEDLSDNAILERLETDLIFRAVATRLVQRYGYLRPTVNPDSDMGKTQDILIKERAKYLAQLDIPQTAKASQSPSEETEKTKSRNSSCDADSGENCYSPNLPDSKPQDSPFFETSPDKDINPPSGGQAPSTPRQQPLLQTDGIPSQAPDEGMYGSMSSGSASLQNVSSPDKQNDTRFYGTGLPDAPGPDLLDQITRGNMQGSEEMAESMVTSDAKMEDWRAAKTSSRVRGKSILAKGSSSNAGATVHRPSPYADIPSLYDLYVQAPSRDAVPQRFGAEVFRDGLRDPRSLPMDLPVGPDYVVGPGDSLSIALWGGISTKLIRTVDRQGRVTLPEAGPVFVSGHSLGDVQQTVQKAIATEYRDTSADVSVTRLRTVRVYVVGEVAQPGAYDISSLSTALNALVASGGVTSKGSLRSLKHMRGRQEVETIDAYDLLLHGATPDALRLENGDSLMIPPMGPQVTVTGMVRRPAVYELNGEKTVSEVLELAGGILPAAALRHVEVQRLEAHEKRTMLSLNLEPGKDETSQLSAFKIQDGDEIHIFPIAMYNQDTIYVQGHVLRPGRYSYQKGMKLTDVIEGYKDLLPEPSAHYAEIIRLNPPDFQPCVVSFDLSEALKNPASAPELKPLDTVRVFSRFDFEAPPTVAVAGEVRSPGVYRTSGQASVRDAVFLAGGLTSEASQDSAQLFRVNADGSSTIFSVNLGQALKGTAGDNILLQPRDRLLIHKNRSQVEPNTVEITGPVAKPGRYPYTSNMRAEDLIQAAGGLTRSADATTADLTRYAASGGASERLQVSLPSLSNPDSTQDVLLHSGDVLAIRQVPGWKDIGAAVKIRGEVAHPSTYGIHPGERLSSVLERAGGYTNQAYPYGAVLTRREVRDLEYRNQVELIDRLKAERLQLRALPENDADQRNAKTNALAQTDTTLNQLSSAPPIGRVVVHIQGDIKSWKNTGADIPLRDGDELVIPKKETVVTVTGQVFNPTAIASHSGRSAKWYLSQAGGLTPIADKKGVFVIRADGSVIAAKNNTDGWFTGNPLSSELRPGDIVVVPEKTPKVGGVNWATVMQTAQVASSVALAVAYIHP